MSLCDIVGEGKNITKKWFILEVKEPKAFCKSCVRLTQLEGKYYCNRLLIGDIYIPKYERGKHVNV